MKKSLKFVIIAVIIALFVSAFYCVIKFEGYTVVTPFTNSYEFMSPSYVIGYGAMSAVVDNGGTRVVLLDKDMKVQRILSSGNHFNKLDYVAMNSNGIYIADIQADRPGTVIALPQIDSIVNRV